MGVRSVLRQRPIDAATKAVMDPVEQQRRLKAKRRVQLYHDDFVPILKASIYEVFREPSVRVRLEPFIKMAASESLFKRVVDEIAGPAYQVPPTRRVLTTSGESSAMGQSTFDELAKQCRLNEKMDKACRMVHATNAAFLYYRNNERLGLLLDVLTPDIVTVIPDPDDPTRELAIIYDRVIVIDGRRVQAHVFWDDEETFTFTRNGAFITMPARHDLGSMPFVPIHRRERLCGQYWDETTGSDLEDASIAVALLSLLRLKLHKSQGFKQIVVVGDIMGFPTDQVFDEEHGLLAPEGTSIQTLDLTTSADHYTKTIDDIARRVAANYGINLDRLNAQVNAQASETGLFERREDAVKIFRVAEERGFNVMQMVTAKIGEQVAVDFGEISLRIDPMGTLGLWKEQRSMGLRNVLDDIRAVNPEIESDEEAWVELDRNMAAESEFVRRRRALNVPEDASMEEPGQDPAKNGSTGPLVRDGKMSKDEAAAAAKTGDPKSAGRDYLKKIRKS